MSGGRCNCGSPHCSSRHPYSGDDRYAQTVYIYTITIYTDCIVQTVYAQIVYMHSHRRLYVYTHSPYGQTVYVHNHRTVQTVYGQIAYIMMHSHRMHSLCMHCICAQSPFCICRPYSQTVRMQDRMEDLAIPTLPGPGLSRWKSWCAGGCSSWVLVQPLVMGAVESSLWCCLQIRVRLTSHTPRSTRTSGRNLPSGRNCLTNSSRIRSSSTRKLSRS